MQADHRPTELNAAEDRITMPGNVPQQSGASRHSVSIAHELAPPIHSPRRILIIDDNIINCQVATQILKATGCDVDSSISSLRALDLHRQQPYDLILMDCQMPELDGYQAAQRIRADEAASRRTVIIGWTSTNDSGERAKCLNTGMDDLMMKPIRASAANDMVGRWLTQPMTAPTSATRIAKTETMREAESDLLRTRRLFGPHFAELATLYLTDTPLRIAALRKAMERRDAVTIAAVSHILGGSSCSIGATRVADACRNLEKCCKLSKLEACEELLKEIEAAYQEISSTLERCCDLQHINAE